MLSVFQWNETSASVASTTFSANAVTSSDSTAALGILSGADIDGADLLVITGEFPGNTGGTLDVYVQTFMAGHWYDFCHIKQLGAGAGMQRIQYVAGRASQVSGTVLGIDGTPALASDTIVGGVWGEKFRLVMVSGTSTSLGVAVKVTLAAQLGRMYSQR